MDEEEFLQSFCNALEKNVNNQTFVVNLEELITKRKITNTSYKKLIKEVFLE